MKIVAEKTKFHRFALYYEYSPEYVAFCRDLKDSFGWQEFSFDAQGELKRWIFTNSLLIPVIAERFPDVEIDPLVEEIVQHEQKWVNEQKKKIEKIEEVKTKTDTNFHIKGLKKELYNYQRVGVEFLTASGGRAIIADEMGTGKSAQALAYIKHMGFKRTLVVCPASVKFSWEGEVKKWTNLKSVVIDSKTKLSDIDTMIQVWIINYDILRKHFSQLSKIRFDALVGDESQMLKSPQAIRTKAFRTISREIPSVVLLSGTPLLSRPSELFSLLNIIDPKTWTNWWDFARKYCTPAESPVLMGDFKMKPISKVMVGEAVLGWEDGVNGPRPMRRLTKSIVLKKKKTRAEVFEVTLTSGKKIKCTKDHLWLNYYNKQTSSVIGKDEWVSFLVGRGRLTRVVDVPEPLKTKQEIRAAGYLAGIYDGEGTGMRISQSAIKNPVVTKEIKKNLDILKIEYTIVKNKGEKCGFYLYGGRQTLVDFVNRVNPSKVLLKHTGGMGTRFKRKKEGVVSYKSLGIHSVYGLKTTTGNYIVWGIASKNCAMKQTHWGIDTSGASNIDELHDRIRRYFIRRMKSEVLAELPPKTFVDVPVQLDKDIAHEYNTAANNLAVYLRQYSGKQPPEIAKAMAAEKLTQLNILRQLSAMGKVDTAMELIESFIETGEKMLVFSSFVAPLEAIKERLGDKAVILTGKTPIEDRQAIVEAFQSDKRVQVFLGGYLSAGTGITLTAASVFLGIDLPWTPSSFSQATDRLHRPGQMAENITIYQLSAIGTIDEDMRDTLEHKQGIFDRVIDGKAAKEVAESAMDKATKRILENY